MYRFTVLLVGTPFCFRQKEGTTVFGCVSKYILPNGGEFDGTFIMLQSKTITLTHTMHVWYICLHEWLIFMGSMYLGKYTSPMDPMGLVDSFPNFRMI